MKRILFLIVSLAISLTSCRNNTLSVNDAWIRAGIAGENSAAYMVINNATDQDEVLLNAASDVAEAVELHMSKMDDQGVMMMQQQENIPIAKGTTVELKQGGLHIMLIGLKQDLVAGESIQLTLTFQNTGDITLELPVHAP